MSNEHEALEAIAAQRARLELEIEALDAKLALRRAAVAERREGLDAVSRLGLPGASIVLQFGFALQMFNWGPSLLAGDAVLYAICAAPIVFALGAGWRLVRREQRLEARLDAATKQGP